MKLLEIWKEFDPTYDTIQRSKDRTRSYQKTLRIILKEKRKAIPSETVLDGVKKLMTDYPAKGYYFQGVKVGRRVLQKIGREVQGQRDIPLYHSAKTGKLYVEQGDVKRSKSLTVRVLSYRLGALGIKYTTELVSERRIHP